MTAARASCTACASIIPTRCCAPRSTTSSRSTICSTTSTQAWATGAYHWFFMIQTAPMPERLMSADPDFFIEKKLAKTEQGLSFFGKEALEEYKRCFRNPETVRGMCEDYRACASVDLAMDTAGLRGGQEDHLPGAAAVGRDRAGRTAEQSAGDLEELRDRHPRRAGAALRALSLGGSAGRDLRGDARVFHSERSIRHQVASLRPLIDRPRKPSSYAGLATDCIARSAGNRGHHARSVARACSRQRSRLSARAARDDAAQAAVTCPDEQATPQVADRTSRALRRRSKPTCARRASSGSTSTRAKLNAVSRRDVPPQRGQAAGCVDKRVRDTGPWIGTYRDGKWNGQVLRHACAGADLVLAGDVRLAEGEPADDGVASRPQRRCRTAR